MVKNENLIPVPDSYRIDNLIPNGRFTSPVSHTHPKDSYFFIERYPGEENVLKRIIKYLPFHTARAEVIGATIFQILGLRSPRTFIADVTKRPNASAVIMEDLSGDYVAFDSRDRLMMNDSDFRDQFKRCLLAAILIGDYDRVTWNTMVSSDSSSDNPRIAFIDFGAACGSRAQGGYNGFNPWIDVEEIRHVIASPYDLDSINSPIFREVLDIQEDELIIEDKDLLSELATELEALTDEIIDGVVALAKYPDVNHTQGKEKAIKIVDQAIDALISNLEEFSFDPEELNYIKSRRALETYSKIANDFNYDMAAYFASALKSRRDDLIKMFKQ